MNFSTPNKLILIGSSTGGPGLLEKIVGSLTEPIDFSIVIAQHMHSLALSSFAHRLDRLTVNDVVFVQERTVVQNGKIYLLEDSSYFENSGDLCIQKCETNEGFYHPDVDIFFSSAKDIKTVEVVAYLLSGMGQDGAKGMLELKKRGFKTVAQDEATSIIYGMPKSAYEIGACEFVMSIDEIAQDIKRG